MSRSQRGVSTHPAQLLHGLIEEPRVSGCVDGDGHAPGPQLDMSVTELL